jgi:hypothetical protein
VFTALITAAPRRVRRCGRTERRLGARVPAAPVESREPYALKFRHPPGTGGIRMSDTAPLPPPAPPAAAATGWGPAGKVRSPVAVIIFSIITLGIYFLVWTYKVFQELKDHTGDGVGGVVGLVIGLLIGIVNWFLLPSEIGNMYAKAGLAKPVTGVTGFWNFIPLIGAIIWIVKVQGALNRRWESLGAS